MPNRDETQTRYDSLIVLIRTLHQALRAALDDALRGTDHTLPQQAVMATLARIPGASNAELARQAFVSPQSMGVAVARSQGLDQALAKFVERANPRNERDSGRYPRAG
jgi:hypothetical protein